MFKSYIENFYVGEVLFGQLSCTWTGLVIVTLCWFFYAPEGTSVAH